MKRYLITGGTGFIGSAIARKLLENGQFVRVLDNESRGSITSIPNTYSHFEFLQADIRDKDKVIDACRDIDAILHLAFINGTKYFYEKPDLVLEVGVKGITNILDGAKQHKVKEFYLASSSEVYQTPPIVPTPEDVPFFIPDPHNPRYSYAGGKIISELLTIHMGKKLFKKNIIFRPHNVYGPNMGGEHVIPELIKKLLDLRQKNKKEITLPIQGTGEDTRAFIYIDDFVDAVIFILEKGETGEIYNIGNEDEISIKKLVAELSTVTNTSIKITSGIGPKGSVSRRCPDITKLKKLGFKSKISLSEGLKKTFEWYKNH